MGSEMCIRDRIFISGVTSSALPFTLIAYSTIYATSGYVSILNATVPIWSVFVVYFWIGERPSVQALIGVLIGFAGVIVLNGDKISVNESVGVWAILSTLAATFFYALTSSHRKLYLDNVSPLAVTAGGQLFSALILLPLAWLYWPEDMPSTRAWVSTVILGVVCTAIAFLIFFRLLANVGISKTVSVAYLIPVSAVLLGFIVLGETITWHMMIGGSLILLGVGFTTEIIRFRRPV